MTCGRPSRPVARRPPPSGAPGTGGPLRLAPEAEAGPRWRLRTQMEPRSPARRVAGAGGPPRQGRDWPSAGGRWARRECDGHGACDWPSMAPQDGRWTARVPDLGTDPGHRGPRRGLRVSTPSTGGGGAWEQVSLWGPVWLSPTALVGPWAPWAGAASASWRGPRLDHGWLRHPPPPQGLAWTPPGSCHLSPGPLQCRARV